MKIRHIVASLVIIFLSQQAPARAGLLLDGGFEINPPAPGSYTQYAGSSTLGGGSWNVLGNDVLLIDSQYTETNLGTGATLHFNAQEGNVALDLTGAGNTGPTDGVSQAVSTVVGQGYDLSFYVGRMLGQPGDSRYSTPSTLNLSINGGVLTPFTNSSTVGTLNTVNYQRFDVLFIATSTTTTLAFTNGTSNNNFVGLDNVSFVATPEPSTIALAGIAGLVGLGLAARGRLTKPTV